jgi:hypothetical protein
MDASALTPAVRLALAVAWVLASQVPTWGLLLWIASSSAAWRVAATSPWLRLLTAAYATVGTLVASVLGAGVLLRGDARTGQRIVIVVWIAQAAALNVGVWLVKKRRGGGRWLPPTQLPPKKRPPLWPLVTIFVLWTVLTGAWVVLRFTSLSAAPPSSRDWVGLACSLSVLGALVWLLVVNVRAARRDVTKDGHNTAAV